MVAFLCKILYTLTIFIGKILGALNSPYGTIKQTCLWSLTLIHWRTMKRVKYLNNRDLLAQIHASKNTYCSYVSPEDARYDIIVPNLKKINIRTIAEAKKNKAKRLTQEAWEQAKVEGKKKIKIGRAHV